MLLTFRSAAVSVIGAGKGLPVEISDTLGVISSVAGGLLTSALGINSCTVAVTVTLLPITAAAGGAVEVKTKTPSEVFGSASAFASGVCKKKPLLLSPVTMPLVVTTCPVKGELVPLPCMSWTATGGKFTVSAIVPLPVRICASVMVKGRDFAPAVVAPATVAENEKILSPAVTSPCVPSS